MTLILRPPPAFPAVTVPADDLIAFAVLCLCLGYLYGKSLA